MNSFPLSYILERWMHHRFLSHHFTTVFFINILTFCCVVRHQAERKKSKQLHNNLLQYSLIISFETFSKNAKTKKSINVTVWLNIRIYRVYKSIVRIFVCFANDRSHETFKAMIEAENEYHAKESFYCWRWFMFSF